MLRTLTSLTIIATFFVPLAAQAQDPAHRAAAANALGITEAQFIDCMPANATPGERLPQSERRKVVDCFKAANPSLTNSKIRSALMDLRG
ncbi:MAG: hypothetical protein AAF822_05225 [Pseudomonadota bacterium]